MIYIVIAVSFAVGLFAGRHVGTIAHERYALREEEPIKRHVVDRILGFWGEPPTNVGEWELVQIVYCMRDPYPTDSSIAAFVVGMRNASDHDRVATELGRRRNRGESP